MIDEEALDALLEEIELLDERGEASAVRLAVDRARKQFPDAIEPREWAATIAIDDERLDDAVVLLDELLAFAPDHPFARRERGLRTASRSATCARFSQRCSCHCRGRPRTALSSPRSPRTR